VQSAAGVDSEEMNGNAIVRWEFIGVDPKFGIVKPGYCGMDEELSHTHGPFPTLLIYDIQSPIGTAIQTYGCSRLIITLSP
jgi:hypothetical protein